MISCKYIEFNGYILNHYKAFDTDFHDICTKFYIITIERRGSERSCDVVEKEDGRSCDVVETFGIWSCDSMSTKSNSTPPFELLNLSPLLESTLEFS